MTTAVLLSCHGSVDALDELPAFLTNIRRGRPAPPEIVAEVTHRYGLIGGSPLNRLTAAQAAGLEAELRMPVAWCGRLWKPYADEVLSGLLASGVDRVVSLPLAPQSVHVYHPVVREAAARHPGLTLLEAPAWGEHPALVDALLETVDEALARFDAAERAGVAVVLTAHSLPVRAIAAGDPYEAQFRAMAGAVAARLEASGHPTRVAFQSQGMTGDAWLGPDLLAVLRALAGEGRTRVVVAPIGFVADHVETLYDLDVDLRGRVAELGLARLERAPALNARPSFVRALAAVVRETLAASS